MDTFEYKCSACGLIERTRGFNGSLPNTQYCAARQVVAKLLLLRIPVL